MLTVKNVAVRTEFAAIPAFYFCSWNGHNHLSGEQLGMEQTTTNSLVPFQPFQLGRMKLRHTLTGTYLFVSYTTYANHCVLITTCSNLTPTVEGYNMTYPDTQSTMVTKALPLHLVPSGRQP